MRKTPLQGSRKPATKRKTLKGPKMSEAALKRSWGMPANAWMRYKGIKGIYWYLFAKKIKERDYAMWQGKCITCGMYVDPSDAQGGHFLAAKDCGFALLFHPLNIHLQHSYCNNPRFSPNAGIYNTINIKKRYGDDIVDKLLAIKAIKGVKEWSKTEYENQLNLLHEKTIL